MAVDKKIKYDDKPVVQGGVDNYLGKQPQVVAPRKWKSAPDKPETELAYITKAEKDLILKANIHGGLEDGPNMGPSGIMSLDSFGDIGGAGAAGVDTDPGGGYDTGPKGGGFTGQGPNESDTAFNFRKMNQKELLQNAEKIQAQNLGTRERRNISDFKPRNNFFTRTLNRGVGFAKRNPLQVLLGFLNPVFGAAMLGANFLNNPERRKRLTGYETQEEYDQARQNRINLNRIKTIENTLARKYADGDYSQTNLDERLAALKSQMGITPNTAADLRPDLDFSNQSELAFEGIGSLDSPASGFVAAKGPDFSSLLNQNQKRNTLANVEFNRMGSYLDGVTDRELYGNFNTIKPTNLNDFEGLYSLPEKKDFLGNTSEDYQISPNNINAYQAKSDIAPQFQDLVRRVGINETQKKMIDSAVNMYGKVNPDQKIDATTQQEIFDSVKKFDTKAKDKTLGLFGGQEADPMTKQEYQDYLISQGYI